MTIQSRQSSNQQSPVLIDNFGRRLNYLRLAVTDRCNLRCVYCMPEKGIDWIPRADILSYEEMLRLVRIFSELGVTKVRLTGGEPFLRKKLIEFLEKIKVLPGIRHIHITTNGVLTAPHVPQLKALGIQGINLSLDTLKRERFIQIARRDFFDSVMNTFHELLAFKIPLKINTVVYPGLNEDEIIPIARLAENHPIEVRFIEQMPFNGNGDRIEHCWNWKQILEVLQQEFPGIKRISEDYATATCFQIPGFVGRVGIIGGYSRIFCQTCSRLRVTPRGMLKTCLYDQGVLDLKQMLRTGARDEEIKEAIRACVSKRAPNGFEAEKRARTKNASSMATIGG